MKYEIPPGVQVDPAIQQYITTVNPKARDLPPLAVKVDELTTDQRREMAELQLAGPQLTKTFTNRDVEIVRTISWLEACVTKSEADQFKRDLVVDQGWIFSDPKVGPLTSLLLNEDDRRWAPYKFIYKRDETLANGNVLYGGEKCAIWLYTFQTYQLINGTLSNNQISLRRWMKEERKLDPNAKESLALLERCQREVPRIAEMTMSGIHKLPSFKGTLYRGYALSKEQLELWKKGKMLMTEKLFSFSTRVDIGEKFARETAVAYMKDKGVEYKPVLYVLQSESAKSISKYSYRPYEEEYVYPPGQFFESVAVDEETVPGLAIIYLQEEK